MSVITSSSRLHGTFKYMLVDLHIPIVLKFVHTFNLIIKIHSASAHTETTTNDVCVDSESFSSESWIFSILVV